MVTMISLTSEEIAAVTELTGVYQNGDSVREFIDNRLYRQLSRDDGTDSFGNQILVPLDGFDEQMDIYESLADKGLLSSHRFGHNAHPTFDGLTSLGRCYLSDREAEVASAKESLRAAHSHDYKVACFSFAGGAVAGGAVTVLLRVVFGF